MSAGMGETEDEKSETNPAVAEKELAPLRNSDATTYDTETPIIIPLHAPRPHLAYDPAALEDSAKNNEEKNRKTSILLRGNLFIHHITPERPQPLQPISTRITVHDFRHQDNRMTITVEVLPWGGYSFAAPFDYEHPVFEGKVLRFRGDLRGHWTVKEFIWERGGRAFLRVDEEDMDYRATIGFPRACVHMQGPDPEVNHVGNWHADQRMARRHNNHLDKWIFHGPPPPPPLPEGFHCSV
ncbi:hypothetical protein K438DRAFT_745007 [Mycena galopus ATCC 62051]|nr:hypothetical protein K438DRAFT_745007 [Mycena galopus ATCC 62051]